jgi:hypothetical protein
MSWNPGNTILENFEDYEMKRNPTKVFRNLAPTSFAKPDEWKRKKKADDEKDSKKGKKNKISKKGQAIIEANIKKQQEKNTSIEIEKLDKTFEPLKASVKTEDGKFYKSLKCLEFFLKRKENKSIIDIWLSYNDKYNDLASKYKKGSTKRNQIESLFANHKTLLKDTKEIYSDVDNIVRYQLEEMPSYLPPLDYLTFYNREFVLDDWQSDALDLIDKKKSIVLCAPTSSGKTFLTTYLIKNTGRILFIVPTLPLALQVAAMFYQLESGTVWVLDEDLTYRTEKLPKIIVGTPYEIMRKISELKIEEIDSLVIDEIHEINNKPSLETICHIMLNQEKNIQFLGLSATIGNPDQFHNWLRKFIPDIKLITVNDRFFNLTRFIYKNKKLKNITPCHTMRVDDLLVEGRLDYPFTPKDCVILSDKMKKHNFEIINPEDYFQNGRITLKQCKKYSQYLLNEMQKSNPEKLIPLIDEFQKEMKDMDSEEKIDIYDLSNYVSNNDLTPSIFFNLDSLQTKSYFDQLLNEFQEKEKEAHPRYQQNLQKALDKYNKSMESRKRDLDRITNEEKKLQWERDNPEPSPPESIGTPHPDFCLTIKRDKVNLSDIKENKEKICQEFIKRNMADQIPALLELFNGLLRGFAIYSEDLPTAYLRCVQELTQQGKLAIIFSDRSLAFGINMPIRCCTFLGETDDLDTLMYQQMEGRCGRRGLDKKGTVIFAGFTKNKICNLVNGTVIPIIGNKNIISDHIFALPEMKEKKKIIKSLYSKNLAKFNNQPDLPELNLKESIDKIYKLSKDSIELLWKLSKYKEAYAICHFMVWFSKQPKLHIRNSDGDDIKFFALISPLLQPIQTENKEKQLTFENSYRSNKEVYDNLIEFIKTNEIIDYDIESVDDNLFKTFRMNGISKEDKSDIHKFSILKEQLINANQIMLNLRNHYRKTPMELILRKVWRRLYWISKTIAIY